MKKPIINQQEPFDILANLPYQVSFYNENLKLLYSNSKSGRSPLSIEEEETLPEWILDELQKSLNHCLHTQIPTDSFDAVLMQSYQAIYDENNQLQGIYSYIQDVRPLLSSYLEESGQTIVTWSDVTSGPSTSGTKIFEV